MTASQRLFRIEFCDWQTFAITLPARSEHHACRRAQTLLDRHGNVMFEELHGTTEGWTATPIVLTNPQETQAALYSLIRFRDLRLYPLQHLNPRYIRLLSALIAPAIANLRPPSQAPHS
ncbi:MAG: hypothetical protein WC807_16510 [Hyphomicrobium sp.]|jgi:hypothetical protein